MIKLPGVLSDVSIKMGTVPAMLEGATSRGVLWQAAPNRFLIAVPKVARYLAENGRQITIDPLPHSDSKAVARFLGMTPLAALLFQRGVLAFHSAAVAHERQGVLVAGASGAGKSTLLAELTKRGWIMLADDLSVVDVNADGHPITMHVSSEISLWPDTLKELAIEQEQAAHADSNRMALSQGNHIGSHPYHLRAIYWLGVHNGGFELKKIKGTSKFKAIGSLLYNSQIADAELDRGIFIRAAAGLAQTTEIVSLRRPRGVWSVAELADVIEKESL